MNLRSSSESVRYTESAKRESLAVYQIAEPVFNASQHAKISKGLQIRAKVQEKEALRVCAEKNRMLTYYDKSGALWYGDFDKLHNPEHTAKVPSVREAPKIASSFLSKFGLLVKDRKVEKVSDGIFESVQGKEREKKQWINHRCVDFRQTIDGIPTHGPGARTKVFIGNNGQVVGFFHAPAELKKYAEFPLRSEEQMTAILEAKLGISPRKVTLKQKKLAYYAESITDFTRFLQPVYAYTFSAESKTNEGRPVTVEFEPHPLPATSFAPVVIIDKQRREVNAGADVSLSCRIDGGTPPYRINWESAVQGGLGNEQKITIKQIAAVKRGETVLPHTITVTVIDANGMKDKHQIAVNVVPSAKGNIAQLDVPAAEVKDWGGGSTNYVGVEWCNIYNGAPGLGDISGTDDSAKGFLNTIKALPGWAKRFEWGNNAAWEQDFKYAAAPGGGTDTNWADNVHFAFFAGHGSSGAFYFGSTVDDHTMEAQHAEWGDGMLNWIVLHACQTMRSNFEWDVWCDSFKGLHEMFGFHTNTEGSTPPLGSRFAFWSSFNIPIFFPAMDLRTAWKTACMECYGADREYSVIYAGQSGTDTHNDHLPGYGHVSADPTSPNFWAYYKGTC